MKTFNSRYANGPWEDLENNAPSAPSTSQAPQSNPQEESSVPSLPMPKAPSAPFNSGAPARGRKSPVVPANDTPEGVLEFPEEEVSESHDLGPHGIHRFLKSAFSPVSFNKRAIKSWANEHIKASEQQGLPISSEAQRLLGIRQDAQTGDWYHNPKRVSRGMIGHTLADDLQMRLRYKNPKFAGGSTRTLGEVLQTPHDHFIAPDGSTIAHGQAHTMERDSSTGETTRTPRFLDAAKTVPEITDPLSDANHVNILSGIEAINLLKKGKSLSGLQNRWHAIAHGTSTEDSGGKRSWLGLRSPKSTPVRINSNLSNSVRVAEQFMEEANPAERGRLKSLRRRVYVHDSSPYSLFNEFNVSRKLYDIADHVAASEGGHPAELRRTGEPRDALLARGYEKYFGSDSSLGQFKVHPNLAWSRSKSARLFTAFHRRAMNRDGSSFQIGPDRSSPTPGRGFTTNFE